jgi:hypothetical protein
MGYMLRRGLALILPASFKGATRMVVLEITDIVFDDKRQRAIARPRLCRRLGMESRDVAKALDRAAALGLDLRVPLSTDKHGKAVYAVPGLTPVYRVPDWVPLIETDEDEVRVSRSTPLLGPAKGVQIDTLSGVRVSQSTAKGVDHGTQAVPIDTPTHTTHSTTGQKPERSSPRSDRSRAAKRARPIPPVVARFLLLTPEERKPWVAKINQAHSGEWIESDQMRLESAMAWDRNRKQEAVW